MKRINIILLTIFLIATSCTGMIDVGEKDPVVNPPDITEKSQAISITATGNHRGGKKEVTERDVDNALNRAGARRYNVTNITFTNSSEITSIGEDAFEDCRALTLTSLPAGITTIKESAFENCSSLALDFLPSGLISIGEGAFEGCSSLALTFLPDGITNIREETFAHCTSLALESLPSGLTSIGEKAFINCISLRELILPCNPPRTYGDPFRGVNLTLKVYSGCLRNYPNNRFAGRIVEEMK